MASEYIRLTCQERIYGQKNMLTAQLNLLTALKHYHNYKELRKEELMLKILLKKHAEETLQSLELINALFPKTQKKDISIQKENPNFEKKLSLSQEIDAIKKKIQMLS